MFGSGGAFAKASQYLYDGETVLLGRKGTIDKPLYYVGKFWTVDTMYWSRIKPGCNGRYAYYSCLTIPFGYYQTSTALPSMTKALLGSHTTCSPPLKEQLAIACFLDKETAKIDALIAKQERLIELLQEKLQAVISHAVSKGLNPDAPMKNSGVEWLGEVPENWKIIPLNYVLKAVGDVDCYMPESTDSGIPYIMTGDLKDFASNIDFDECKQVSEENYEQLSKKIKTQKGDLILARYATIGTVSYVDIDKRILVSY